MALHPNFPKSPYEILNPNIRWFPADEALRTQGYEKLLPPLVSELRKAVKTWRDKNYDGASATSKSLLNWWFKSEHIINHSDGNQSLFKYYFAQREAVETVIYLNDIVKVKDKYDLMRFDASGVVSASMFPESWRRYVIKMATGSGKTKVLSLLIAWSYFHKLYEEDSDLSRNFLLIAPNIIVLDRLRTDFDGLKIFFSDPVLPDDGYEDQNWKSDFNLNLHIQDEVNITQKTGNLFLTNIHRVYESQESVSSYADEDTTNYFLGDKPVNKTNESKVDLSTIVREIDELAIFNDEAHHVHDERMAWFKSVEDIHNKLKLKGSSLSLQIDVTATPKHNNGAIFVQTVSDYPLVEAIHQDVVKHPVLPDSASRAKLQENQSSKFTERYKEYLDFVEKYKSHLGYVGDYTKGEIEMIFDINLFPKCEEGAAERMFKSGASVEDARKRAQIGIFDENRWGLSVHEPLRLPDGSYTTFNRWISWGSLESGFAGVVIAPFTTDGKLIFLKNYRNATKNWCIEFPRGGKDLGNSLLKTVKNELSEEMGAEMIGDPQKIGEVFPDSAVLSSRVDIYKAVIEIIVEIESKFDVNSV